MKRIWSGNYLALGIALGAGLGLAFHNLPMGVAVGTVLGAAFTAINHHRSC